MYHILNSQVASEGFWICLFGSLFFLKPIDSKCYILYQICSWTSDQNMPT